MANDKSLVGVEHWRRQPTSRFQSGARQSPPSPADKGRAMSKISENPPEVPAADLPEGKYYIWYINTYQVFGFVLLKKSAINTAYQIDSWRFHHKQKLQYTQESHENEKYETRMHACMYDASTLK